MSIFDGLIGSGLGVVGSVASTLIGNSQNVKLAREQREWDYKMWKENNEYNSPLNQMNRLRSAGLNPGLAMSNGLIGNGLSSQSAGGQTAPVTDFSPIAQGIRDSVDLYQQKRLQDAQIEKLNSESQNQSIKNRYENQKQILELQQMLENKDLTSAQRRHILVEIYGLSKQNEWIDKKNSAEIAKSEAEARQAHAQVSYFAVLEEGQRLANEFAPQHQRAILSEIGAHINELNAAAADSNEHAAYNVAMKALSNAQEKGVNIDNNTKKRMSAALVSKAMAEASGQWADTSIKKRAARTGTWSTKFFGSYHDSNVSRSTGKQSGGIR